MGFSELVEKKRKNNNCALDSRSHIVNKKIDFSDLVKKSKKITKIMRVWAPKLNYEIMFTFPDKK